MTKNTKPEKKKEKVSLLSHNKLVVNIDFTGLNELLCHLGWHQWIPAEGHEGGYRIDGYCVVCEQPRYKIV